ncbi:hypothetical protein BGW41_003075 [Actinomortierella wolfii]|nr:hypothetical protein BGW41_003075 [Actinomortierella wolfii]
MVINIPQASSQVHGATVASGATGSGYSLGQVDHSDAAGSYQSQAAAFVREYTNAVQTHQQLLQQQQQQQQQLSGGASNAKILNAFQAHIQQLPPYMQPPPSPNTLSYYYHQDRGWLRLERSGSVDAYHHLDWQRARAGRGSFSDHQYLDSILHHPAVGTYDESQALLQHPLQRQQQQQQQQQLIHYHQQQQQQQQQQAQTQPQSLIHSYQQQVPASYYKPHELPPKPERVHIVQHTQQQPHHGLPPINTPYYQDFPGQQQHAQNQPQQNQHQGQYMLPDPVQAYHSQTHPHPARPATVHYSQRLVTLPGTHGYHKHQQQPAPSSSLYQQQPSYLPHQSQQLQPQASLYEQAQAQLNTHPQAWTHPASGSQLQMPPHAASQQLQLQQAQLQKQQQLQQQQMSIANMIQRQQTVIDRQRQGHEQQQQQQQLQQQQQAMLAAALAQQQQQQQHLAAVALSSGPLSITKVYLGQIPQPQLVVQIQLADGKSQQVIIDVRQDEWRDYLLAYAHTLYAAETTSHTQSPPLISILQIITTLHPSHLPTLLLLACVHYTRRNYQMSLHYNNLILTKDPNYVEAMSNIGTTLRSMGRQSEAESWWWKAVRLRPGYWDAVENLIGVLCSGYGATESSSASSSSSAAASSSGSSANGASAGSGSEAAADGGKPEKKAKTDKTPVVSQPPRYKEALKICEFVEANVLPDPNDPTGEQPPPLPIQHVPRLQNLLYAKGNLKYALGDMAGARREYERSLEIVFGQGVGAMQIVYDIMTVIRMASGFGRPSKQELEGMMLLLRPEEALQLTQLVFRETGGVLPGLATLAAACADGTANTAAAGGNNNAALWQQANQTTSTILLTLAKLYQDVMDHPTKAKELAGGDDYVPTMSMLLPLYYLSLALNPSPSTCNNLGILLSSIPPSAPTITYPTPAQPMQLHIQANGLVIPTAPPPAMPVTGQGLALQFYNYGLQLDPRHPHLYTNLGSLLKDMGQLNEAVAMYEKAVECNPRFDVALANLGNAIKDLGKVQESVQWYLRAVEINPNFSEAVCGLVNALGGVCDWRGRGGVGAVSVSSDGQLTVINTTGMKTIPRSGWMGRVVEIVEKQLNEGALWGMGVVRTFYNDIWSLILRAFLDSDPHHPDADLWKERLDGWIRRRDASDRRNEGGWIIRLFERATRRLQRSWYLESYEPFGPMAKKPGSSSTSSASAVNLLEKYRRPMIPHGMAPPPVPTVLPFHTFTYPLSARQIRLISHRNALRITHGTLSSHWLPNTVYPPPRPPQPRLKIGYVSSDFNNHPLSHLMQSVFGMHDKQRFEIFCYATTPADQTPYRAKIQSEVEHFIEVSTWSTQAIVERIVADGIHILVNLNGYTKGARNEVFAARPSPVQASFMGFAGTLGAGWCDWIIADPIVCPPEMVNAVAWRRKQRKLWEQKAKADQQQNGAMIKQEDSESHSLATISTKSNGSSSTGGSTHQKADSVIDESAAWGVFSDFEGDLDPEEPGDDWVYTEKFIYMPHSYFVNDHRQGFREEEKEQEKRLLQATEPHLAASVEWAWHLEQDRRWQMRKELFPNIAENTVIFANFNQLYKIDPLIFMVWLRILQRVPNSILWLLRFPAAGEAHLLRTAHEWAGPAVASRVIFTDVAPKQVHIHRGRVADLFLDTPECNAHTTAADILWSGTPILTFPKYQHKMCSRVGASIAYATGYGHELIVGSEQEYEDKAVAFAQDCRYEYVEDSVLKARLGLLKTPVSGVGANGMRPSTPAVAPTTVTVALPLQQYGLVPQPQSQGQQQQQQQPPQPLPALANGSVSIVHWIGHGRLMDIRRKLWEHRDGSLLFDTLRWTRNLEKGYIEAWRRWETGEEFDELNRQSSDIKVPAVENEANGGAISGHDSISGLSRNHTYLHNSHNSNDASMNLGGHHDILNKRRASNIIIDNANDDDDETLGKRKASLISQSEDGVSPPEWLRMLAAATSSTSASSLSVSSNMAMDTTTAPALASSTASATISTTNNSVGGTIGKEDGIGKMTMVSNGPAYLASSDPHFSNIGSSRGVQEGSSNAGNQVVLHVSNGEGGSRTTSGAGGSGGTRGGFVDGPAWTEAETAAANARDEGRTGLTPPMSRLNQYGSTSMSASSSTTSTTGAGIGVVATNDLHHKGLMGTAIHGATSSAATAEVLPASGMIFVPDQTQALSQP